MRKSRKILSIIFTFILLWVLSPTSHIVVADAPTEIISKRTANSKTHDLGNNRYSLDASISSIHYQDSSGDWQEIDNSFTQAQPPWSWEMLEAGYNVRVKEQFNDGQILEFSKKGYNLYFQPMNLEWSNDLNQIQLISIPQSVTPTVTNKSIDLLHNVGMPSHEGLIYWDDAYGNNIDFSWEATASRLNKLLTIQGYNDIPPPKQYILDGGNPVLQLSLIFAPPDKKSVDILVDGQVWDRSSKTETFNTIEFREISTGEILWGFMPLFYWDSQDDYGQSVATLSKSGNKLYIEVRVPYDWLQSSVYPVYIDVDVDEQVGADDDDCYTYGGAERDDRTYVYLNYTTASTIYGGYRFQTVNIAQGSTIDVAYLTVNCDNTASDDPTVDLYCEDEDDSAGLESGTKLDDRTLTTASTNWTDIALGLGWHNSPSIVGPVQEVINRGSWVANNDLTVIGVGTVSSTAMTTYDYQGSSANATKIHIEYSAGGGSAPTVTSDAATNVEDTTATLNGTVTDDDGETIDYYGFVWDTGADQGDPGNADPSGPPGTWDFGWKSGVGDYGENPFSHGVTALPTGTTIYYRAAAHNTNGWAYGGSQSFLTKPAAPTNVAASDGTSETKVVVTWTKSTGATAYEVYRDGAGLGALGDVATYDDNGATAGTITNSGIASASDGTSALHVTLSLAGEATGTTSHTYKVVASNATGDSDDSLTDTGYRGVGAITYQWQVDSGGGFGNIAGGTTDPYNYVGAAAGTITAGNAAASDGTSTAHVTLSLVGDGVNNGATWDYQCIVSSTNASNSPQTSTSDTGYRGTDTVSYQWQVDSGGGFGNIAGGTTDPYNYVGAAAGTITAGNAAASDGTSTAHVELNVIGQSTNNGATWNYQCVETAAWASNSPQTSAANTGYRGVGALTYQWYRSNEDLDAVFNTITGGTTDPYNDTSGAVDPDGRWYYCQLDATGAASQDTTHNRGYKASGGGGGTVSATPFVLLGLAAGIGVWMIFTKDEKKKDELEA